MLLLLCTFPLCLTRRLGSLRYSSAVGFAFSLFLMGVISGSFAPMMNTVGCRQRERKSNRES